jgi:hypoxanthine-DNA glycosylase
MCEIHPFEPFVPPKSTILILGSFPGKDSTLIMREDDWFYGARRNQFWKILEKLYGISLKKRTQKEKLFYSLRIAVTDIIYSCERRNNSNLDINLINKTYNKESVQKIITEEPVEKILFTGKGVFREFKKNFNIPGNIEMIALPSPSPANRLMSLEEKVQEYRKYFPELSRL